MEEFHLKQHMIRSEIYYNVELKYLNTTYNIRNDLDDSPYFTTEIRIDKSAGITTHNAKIEFFNLPHDFRVRFNKSTIDTTKNINIHIQIGSDPNSMTSVFKGRVNEFQSPKINGNTYQTTIVAFAGNVDPFSAVSSFSLGSNATVYDLKKQYANLMNVNLVSESSNDIKTLDKQYSSSTNDIITEIKNKFKNEDVFIDNEKIYFFDDNYYKKKSLDILPEISEKSGLLNTPAPYSNLINITCLLKPFITRGSVIKLNSREETNQRLNGIYKVVGCIHDIFTGYKVNQSLRGITEMELMKI